MDYIKEQNLIAQGFKLVCGLDEAGRGPLAGPIVAGAVILHPDKIQELSLINDSKLLNEKKRLSAIELVKQYSLCWSVGLASNFEIDKFGLAFANKIAMKRAWQHLKFKPDYILSDYMAKLKFVTPFELIIKGDQKVISIASASIVAKVFRDNIMYAFAKKYPQYEFEKHKGYGTKIHMQKLSEFGPCEIHRRSFEPVRKLVKKTKNQ